MTPCEMEMLAAVAGVAGFFTIQKVLQKKLPYPLQWNLLISIGDHSDIQNTQKRLIQAGYCKFLQPLRALFETSRCPFLVASSLGSYAVTRLETQKCSDLWLLLETGKVPDRSPAPGENTVFHSHDAC